MLPLRIILEFFLSSFISDEDISKLFANKFVAKIKN